MIARAGRGSGPERTWPVCAPRRFEGSWPPQSAAECAPCSPWFGRTGETSASCSRAMASSCRSFELRARTAVRICCTSVDIVGVRLQLYLTPGNVNLACISAARKSAESARWFPRASCAAGPLRAGHARPLQGARHASPGWKGSPSMAPQPSTSGNQGARTYEFLTMNSWMRSRPRFRFCMEAA